MCALTPASTRRPDRGFRFAGCPLSPPRPRDRKGLGALPFGLVAGGGFVCPRSLAAVGAGAPTPEEGTVGLGGD